MQSNGKTAHPLKGLRKKWFLNTIGIVGTFGIVCVFLITVVFAGYYYSSLESSMRYHTQKAATHFSNLQDKTYEECFDFCADYAAEFNDSDTIALQFFDEHGNIVASSHTEFSKQVPTTADIIEAMDKRKVSLYKGADSGSDKQIMAISSPVVFHDGQLVGVYRFVSTTSVLDLRIGYVALISLLVLILIAAVVLITGNYYIRSVLVPLDEIIEKAKKITSGSYGIQIESKFNDEIGELADTINEMSLQINQNEKIQTEFISSLSHELRTPLTAITGWSETLLSSNDLDGDTRRGMKIIHREAGRLTEMVLELLDFTRIQDGRMTLNMELADIRSEFEDVIYMYGSRLAKDGIQVKYLDTDVEIPEISCDPMRLRQVFLNILDNAAKHGSEGKQIETAIHYSEDTVIITIRDYGPGIPEDELPLVKKKFYKGSSKARGSGIGLAVCDEIVEMHGGTLTLENAQDGGTLVTIELPASQ